MSTHEKKLKVGDVACCQEPWEMHFAVYIGDAYWLTNSGIERLRKFTTAMEARGSCNSWYIDNE